MADGDDPMGDFKNYADWQNAINDPAPARWVYCPLPTGREDRAPKRSTRHEIRRGPDDRTPFPLPAPR